MASLATEGATIEDRDEACELVWSEWVKTAHHSGRRAELVVVYDLLLDRRLELSA